MALLIAGLPVLGGGGGEVLRRGYVGANKDSLPSPPANSWSPPISVRHIRLIAAARKLSSTKGKFDSKNRRNLPTTKEGEDDVNQKFGEIDTENIVTDESFDYGFVVPDLPGEEPDFWEGPQWDGLGFFVEYLWAFGVVFALIACGVAVATYNEGATDFKETPSYKESILSREILEAEGDGSNLEVFEANPTEEAPALE